MQFPDLLQLWACPARASELIWILQDRLPHCTAQIDLESWIPCLYLPGSGITGMSYHACSYVVLRTEPRASVPVRQVLYQLRCIPTWETSGRVPLLLRGDHGQVTASSS